MRAVHGWLPVVLPAEATRFRVADPDLAANLEEAGAILVDAEPEVELAGAASELRGDADLAVVSIVGPESRAGHAAVRAGRRALRSLETRLLAALTRRELRRRGYPQTSVFLWDLALRVGLPGLTEAPSSLAQRLSRYALVIGRKGEPGPTAVAAALEAAEQESGRKLEPHWSSMQPGLVALAVDGSLLRVAIGRTRDQIDNGFAALEALRAADPPAAVADRVPWPLARGKAGLADWSLERLLPGARPPREVPEPLLGDCVDFLTGLGRQHGDGAPAQPFAELAGTVAEVASPESTALLQTLAQRLEARLSGVPRCFAHGDFFAGNLLAEEGRLTGVVDWDAAGPGRLPLLDLLHLTITRSARFADDEWGEAVLTRLLPLARAGGDQTIARYGVGIGVDLTPELLEALVLAYWLDYTAFQLRTHRIRRSQPRWIERNVERMVGSATEALAG
jgi:Phosphotransferase enzyme family